MAIVDAGDANHAAAVAYQDEVFGTCGSIVTNYILDELFTLTLMDLGYRYAVDVKSKLDRLSNDGLLEVVWVDKVLAEEGWNVFERINQDKHWSYTDCTSYAAMHGRGVHEAFTFDHHFEQMGFIQRP